MKFKKSLLALPIIAAVGVGAISVFANNNNDAILLDTGNTQALGTHVENESNYGQNLFTAVSGTVKGIFTDRENGSADFVEIQTDDGRTYHFVVSENTLFARDGQISNLRAIEVGQSIVAHYSNTGMMPAIYPARINASALVTSTETNRASVHVDVFTRSSNFGGQLVSSDNSLRFPVSENTIIVDINNEVYEGSLENKKLAVIFTNSTRSIPALPINPTIVVLGEAGSEHLENKLELFTTVTGKVMGTFESYVNQDGDSITTIIVESEESGVFHFTTNANTLFVKDGQIVTISSIEEGQEINIQFEALQMAEMIFPPRLRASAVSISGEEDFTTVRVDIFRKSSDFEGQLVSSDNVLRLDITEDSIIVDRNNNVYEGTLEDKKLAIIFSAQTMSIPALPINPVIVVLGDAEDVAGVHMLTEVEYSTQGSMISMVELLPEYARGNAIPRYFIELAD